MSGAPKFVQVWRLQWVEESTLASWQESSVITKTPQELERVIDGAAERGFALGELQGRANLRRDIEAGTVEPIREVPYVRPEGPREGAEDECDRESICTTCLKKRDSEEGK